MSKGLFGLEEKSLTVEFDGRGEAGSVPGCALLLCLDAFVEHPDALVAAQASSCRKSQGLRATLNVAWVPTHRSPSAALSAR